MARYYEDQDYSHDARLAKLEREVADLARRMERIEQHLDSATPESQRQIVAKLDEVMQRLDDMTLEMRALPRCEAPFPYK